MANIIYDISTKNSSFLKMMNTLKRLGVKDNKFFLALYDETLVGVDPYSGNLTNTQKCSILRECKRNPWYFLREIVRIPKAGHEKGVPYELTRLNLALTWCILHNIDVYNTSYPGSYKTESVLALLNWINIFIPKITFNHYNVNRYNILMNVRKLRKQAQLLPQYILSDLICSEIFDNLKNEKRTLRTHMTSLGPTPNLIYNISGTIDYYDNFEYIKDNQIYKSQLDPDRMCNRGTCSVITTTPGDLDTKSAKVGASLVSEACKFTENFYDMSFKELYDYIYNNSTNGIVHISSSYKGLGKDGKWYNDMCSIINNEQNCIRREILCERFASSSETKKDTDEEKSNRELFDLMKDFVDFSDLYSSLYKAMDTGIRTAFGREFEYNGFNYYFGEIYGNGIVRIELPENIKQETLDSLRTKSIHINGRNIHVAQYERNMIIIHLDNVSKQYRLNKIMKLIEILITIIMIRNSVWSNDYCVEVNNHDTELMCALYDELGADTKVHFTSNDNTHTLPLCRYHRFYDIKKNHPEWNHKGFIYDLSNLSNGMCEIILPSDITNKRISILESLAGTIETKYGKYSCICRYIKREKMISLSINSRFDKYEIETIEILIKSTLDYIIDTISDATQIGSTTIHVPKCEFKGFYY